MRNQQTIYPVVFLFSILFFLFLQGCTDKSLTFLVQFEEVSGLKQQDRVYLDRNVIGEVGKVTYTNKGDYLVEVTIAPEFRAAATSDSRFFIGHSPDNESAMAVLVEQDHPGGAELKPGVTVAGSARPGYLDKMFKDLKETAKKAESQWSKTLEEWKKSSDEMSAQLGEELEETMDDLGRQFDSFREQVEELPNSQEMEQLEQSVDQFVEEFNQARKEVQEHLREEVLPKLRQELDRLRERLQQDGREQELERVDEQIKELEMV